MEGTIQYVPGGRLNRLLISLKLIKVGLLAVEALYLKKFVSSGFGKESGLMSYNKCYFFHILFKQGCIPIALLKF